MVGEVSHISISLDHFGPAALAVKLHFLNVSIKKKLHQKNIYISVSVQAFILTRICGFWIFNILASASVDSVPSFTAYFICFSAGQVKQIYTQTSK